MQLPTARRRSGAAVEGQADPASDISSTLRPVGVRRIGRELDVRYALTGSIFPEGERLRTNANLVDAQAGAQLWAERFDVERTDLLEVQDEIVGRLARAIGLKVIDVEGRRTERERPKSTDASDLLMRAKVIANRPSSRETKQ